jgi:Ca2+-binding RTX toxin-like protein
MTHFTIAAFNSLAQPTTALTLRAGDDLILLSSGSLAGGITGLAMQGDNAALIRGEIAGDKAVTFSGTVSLGVTASGALLGTSHALVGAGNLLLTNWGEVLTAATTRSAAILVTGGPAATVTNHGLIAAFHPEGQSMDPLAMDVTSDRFFLTNEGRIDGTVSAGIGLFAQIDNAGTMGNLWLNASGEAWIVNHGSMGDLVLTGSGALHLSGQGGQYGTITIDQTADTGFVELCDLGASQITALTIETESWARLDMRGTTIGALDLSGLGEIYLDGATLGQLSLTGTSAVWAQGALSPLTIEMAGSGHLIWGPDVGSVITKSSDGDEIHLGGGDDTLRILANGGVEDLLFGGCGTDLISYADWTGPSGLRVSLGLGLAGGRGAGMDRISGFEAVEGSALSDILAGDARANLILGGGGKDRLLGHAGCDTLDGGAGNDWLCGGAGSDVLTGGAGADVFVFETLAQSRRAAPDFITDFETATDKIDLTGLGPLAASDLSLVVSNAVSHLTLASAPGFELEISGVVAMGDILLAL